MILLHHPTKESACGILLWNFLQLICSLRSNQKLDVLHKVKEVKSKRQTDAFDVGIITVRDKGGGGRYEVS